MSQHHHDHELPERLVTVFRTLGDVEAPDELWSRLMNEKEQLTMAASASFLADAEAPDALWEQVRPAVLAEAQRRQEQEVAPIFNFRQGRRARARLATAAALLIFAGISLFLPGRDVADLESGRGAHQALRDFYRQKVAVLEVDPSQMSSTARALTGALGAPNSGGRSL